MPLTRRQFACLTATLLLPEISHAANADNAIFWRVKFPTYELMLFGYARIAASFVPEILAEGKGLIDKTQAVIIDTNADVALSSIDFDRTQVDSVFPTLSPSQQREVQVITSTALSENLLERLSGFEVAALLLSEGQHVIGPSAPGIGEEFINYGTALKRPVTKLLDDSEVRSAESVRPANTFRELRHPGDDLALVSASMLGLDRDLRGWHGSHGDYFRH